MTVVVAVMAAVVCRDDVFHLSCPRQWTTHDVLRLFALYGTSRQLAVQLAHVSGPSFYCAHLSSAVYTALHVPLTSVAYNYEILVFYR